MEEETILLRVDDVQKALQISEQKAYDVIRTLNEELNAKGYITIRGRVNKEYFMKRYQYSE